MGIYWTNVVYLDYSDIYSHPRRQEIMYVTSLNQNKVKIKWNTLLVDSSFCF